MHMYTHTHKYYCVGSSIASYDGIMGLGLVFPLETTIKLDNIHEATVPTDSEGPCSLMEATFKWEYDDEFSTLSGQFPDHCKMI